MRPESQIYQLFERLAVDHVRANIEPLLKEKSWILFWANGAVVLQTAEGHDITETRPFELFEAEANRCFGDFIGHEGTSPLWALLTTCESFAKPYGPHGVPSLPGNSQ